jgi:putative salt-induced outer membrane protein
MACHLLALLAVVSVSDTGKRITLTADAGVVNVNGNSDFTSLSIGNKLGARVGRWSLGQTFGMTYAKSNDSVTASALQATLRGDRALSTTISLFVLAGFERNRFAGVSSRYSPTAGIAAILVADSSNRLRAEIGGGYAWQNAVAPNPDREYAAGRAALIYHRRLGAKSAFDQAVDVTSNLTEGRDVRINSESAVTAPIMVGVAMKASYLLRYAGLPEPGFKKLDRVLTTGIQVTF